MHLTVWSYHVTYAFQSESTLYSCLNVKEILAQNRRDIWNLSEKFRYHVCFEQWVLDIQANIECGFTLKIVRDMIITYRQMHRTDNYSQYSSVIWSVLPNGWVFVYELSGCGFKSTCRHLNFRYRACFGQGVPWHLGKYKVWIHSEMRMWHDSNIQTNILFNVLQENFHLKFKTKVKGKLKEKREKVVKWRL